MVQAVQQAVMILPVSYPLRKLGLYLIRHAAKEIPLEYIEALPNMETEAVLQKGGPGSDKKCMQVFVNEEDDGLSFMEHRKSRRTSRDDNATSSRPRDRERNNATSRAPPLARPWRRDPAPTPATCTTETRAGSAGKTRHTPTGHGWCGPPSSLAGV